MRTMEYFNDDVWSVISKLCRPIDQLSLSMTSKTQRKLRPDLKIIIKNELIKRLSDGIDIDHFENILIEHNSFISGSFILQVLYDEDWNTDIDIIIPYKLKNNIDLNLYDNLIKVARSNQTNEMQKYLFSKGYTNIILPSNDQVSSPSDRLPIKKLRCGLIPSLSIKFQHSNKQPINIIYIHDQSVKKYMDFYFDCSVCKNIYNFNKLEFFDLNGIITNTTKYDKDFNLYTKNTNLPNSLSLKSHYTGEILKIATEKITTTYKNYVCIIL